MAIIKLSKNERRRLSVFFTCLVLAFLAWVLTTLSKTDKYHIKVAVAYINPPAHRSFRSLQADTVDATVEGTGWDLLFSTMNFTDRTIPVSLKNLESKNYITLNSQLKAINEKWADKPQIAALDPDTLYFDFSSRATKRVPIQLQSKITYEHQYTVSGNTSFRPDYVTVSGPENVIANITSWKTEPLIMDDVSDTVEKTVRLLGVPESNMNIYPRAVQVKIPVEEFTEKTLYVPVKLINNKDYYNVKVFPQKVKITFTVALSSYTTIDESYFDAIADLNLWRDKGYHQLPVTITRVPKYCKVVRIEPQNVDFIVNQ